ncbi:MAG TPA: hypothetical protein VNX88_16220 [Terriglobales bacterium]|nr:hypothetical protein [Terriglobales bacterium]
MGEREDAEREFERVFGKAQKSSEQDASSIHAPTQKLPSDSDVLGIRTDSDRFIFRNPIPERLPIEPLPTPKAANNSPSPDKGGDIPSQDAMTIALNVNVFANIPKPGEERKPGDLDNVAWSEATQLFVRKPAAEGSPTSDGPMFAISLPKEALKPGTLAQGAKQNDDFASVFGSNSGASGTVEPAPTAKFTRIFHVQDSVTLPQSAAPPSGQNPTAPPISIPHPAENPAPATPPATGPSDFTRIVKGSELRALQEKFAAAVPASPNQNAWPAPQPAAPSLPAGMATQIWSASSAQSQRSATQTMQPWAPPNTTLPPMARPPDLPVAEPSKLSQYMPLILVLNLLFLLAILLIVFFAVKK